MIWGRVLDMVAYVFGRRNNRWVEISVTRAWSHDMAPRVFEIDQR